MFKIIAITILLSGCHLMPASKFSADKTNALILDMAKQQYKANPIYENKKIVYQAMKNKKEDTGIIAEHEISALKEGAKAVGGSIFTILSRTLGLPEGAGESILGLFGLMTANHFEKKKKIKKLQQDKEIYGKLPHEHIKQYKDVEREVRGKV